MIRALTAAMCALVTMFASPAQAADDISDGQWYHSFLRTHEAPALSEGSGITVAILDSGVDTRHPDLAGSVLPGRDFVGSSDGRTDVDGHGTAMAGLIVAHGRVKGVAGKSKILPVRVGERFGPEGSRIAEGILWATEQQVDVISISSASTTTDSRLQTALDAAAAADIVIVAGVGNKPQSAKVGYPAASPGVLAVASIDKNGNHAAHSVTGPEVVIAAPGEEISSTSLNSGYVVSDGTSDSTAIVAGAVALIRAKHPQLKAPDVIKLITSTATDKGAPGRDNEYGFGVLNLVGALTASVPAATTAAPVTNTAAAPVPDGNKTGFQWWWIAIPAVLLVGGLLVFGLRQRRT